MTELSPSHPRYRSLLTRARLAAASRSGVVVPEGLIAHGRAEAFDYLLGERTLPSARRATRLAADWVRRAERPVLSVNGNVAALAAGELAALQRAWPTLALEVNLFHRTPGRAAAIARTLRAAGVHDLLGLRPTSRIAGLPSDRARVDARGIRVADLCIIPLEDGDRTDALRRLGKRVVAIDLNPLSRTARRANLTIVDELTRALANLASDLSGPRPRRALRAIPNSALLADALRVMRRGGPSGGPRRSRGRPPGVPGRSAAPPR